MNTKIKIPPGIKVLCCFDRKVGLQIKSAYRKRVRQEITHQEWKKLYYELSAPIFLKIMQRRHRCKNCGEVNP